MKVKTLNHYFNEYDMDDASLAKLKVRNVEPAEKNQKASRLVVHTGQDDLLVNRADDLELVESGFQFCYKPALYESSWLFSSLSGFYADQWFTDILRKVKGGKEASVYLCSGGPHVDAEFLAAKVYRPRQFRNLRKDHIYREGRSLLDGDGHPITDDGKLHAIRKKTDYGKELIHSSWIEHEVQAMKVLSAAGADVPRVYTSGGMAILMDFLGDENGGAPALVEVNLSRKAARRLFDQAVHNITLMLKNGVIHGDLSAYNILYWNDTITLIDFPQVVSPGQNNAAKEIFFRDVQRVCEYFQAQGVPGVHSDRLAKDLWRQYGVSQAVLIDPALLDPDDPHDVDFWENKRTEQGLDA
ncbi:MAG: hypothetical protein HPY85_02585 [Anaerolineae bacterium]|nr:hypothetical protein [Anaerolineae bacterium]